MVPGIDSFREKFKDYTDYYTIIGGTACDILGIHKRRRL